MAEQVDQLELRIKEALKAKASIHRSLQEGVTSSDNISRRK
jgi:hypothetical protein